MVWLAFFSACCLSPGRESAADDFQVKDAERTYGSRLVTAENVKGIELRLSKEILVDDCNTRSMQMTDVLVSGGGDGWHDLYFIDAWVTQTQMFCPSDNPVKETLYSRPMFIKSFTNQNINQKVVVTVVIPDGYELDIRAVK